MDQMENFVGVYRGDNLRQYSWSATLRFAAIVGLLKGLGGQGRVGVTSTGASRFLLYFRL